MSGRCVCGCLLRCMTSTNSKSCTACQGACVSPERPKTPINYTLAAECEGITKPQISDIVRRGCRHLDHVATRSNRRHSCRQDSSRLVGRSSGWLAGWFLRWLVMFDVDMLFSLSTSSFLGSILRRLFGTFFVRKKCETGKACPP